MDIERLKKEMKKKHQNTNEKENKIKTTIIKKKYQKKIMSFVMRFLICVIITLLCFILLKKNPSWKSSFYKYVFEQNFRFASINQIYQKYFGSPIPFFEQLIEEPTKAVFREKLTYKEEKKYQDGVKLTVDPDLLIPSLESGIVVFIGKKEGYGNTLIIQQANGIDCWYGNIKNLSVKLYDYVEQGSALGEANGKNLFLVFKKDGSVLDYKQYIHG